MIEKVFNLFSKSTIGQLFAALTIGTIIGVSATLSEDVNPGLGAIYGGCFGLLAGLLLTSPLLTIGYSMATGAGYVIYMAIVTEDKNVPQGMVIAVATAALLTGILLITKAIKKEKN